MAHTLSAKKRIRQNEKLRLINRARKSQLKTVIRKFTDALAGKDVAATEQAFEAAVKCIDQVAAKGTLHRNAAARRKSRLARRLNAFKAANR